MRADRLLSLMLLLQTRGKMTTYTLAAELGVSRRTILRDVEALSMAGVPIYSEGGHGGGVALDEGYRTTLTGLNLAEVRSLFVPNNASILNDVGLGEAADGLLLKLLAALPPAQRSVVDHLRQRLLVDATWWWHDAEPASFWPDLQLAVDNNQLIEATYEHYDGETVARILEPYSLVNKSSVWYLVARRDGELRIYRVVRFHQLRRLDQKFEREPEFDLQTWWQAHLQEYVETFWVYQFVVRVHPERIAFIKWLVPGRWELLEAADQRGWTTFRLSVDSPLLAKMLVFGLGASGEVVEPPELIAMVQQEANALVQHLMAYSNRAKYH